MVLSRKRKPVDSNSADGNSPKIPASRREIINWEPYDVDGEDEHSCRSHQMWMQKEFKKRSPNMGVISQKMKLTFSFRRKMVNEGKHSLKDIEGKYPFLFHCDQVCKRAFYFMNRNMSF